MIHETITVYRADSCRKENGSQVGLPTFGRFSATVRKDSLRLTEDEDGWYIGLPNGCTLFTGDGGEDETRELWERNAASLAAGKSRDGWIVDREAASREAIRAAAARHNSHVAASSNYARVYGGKVTIETVLNSIG